MAKMILVVKLLLYVLFGLAIASVMSQYVPYEVPASKKPMLEGFIAGAIVFSALADFFMCLLVIVVPYNKALPEKGTLYLLGLLFNLGTIAFWVAMLAAFPISKEGAAQAQAQTLLIESRAPVMPVGLDQSFEAASWVLVGIMLLTPVTFVINTIAMLRCSNAQNQPIQQ